MMKVVFLANAGSIHTVQWANHLARAGIEVFVLSRHNSAPGYDESIKIKVMPFTGGVGYFLMIPKVRAALKEIQPDVLHAHYATGYGLVGRFANFHPYLLSVWGSDVFSFPLKSRLHKIFLRKNLVAADLVASTSVCMANRTLEIAPELKPIIITPFGVDLSLFTVKNKSTDTDDLNITFGTVKSLSSTYGVDVLILAFARTYERLAADGYSPRLRLVGSGPDEGKLRLLVQRLKLEHVIDFIGNVSHDMVPEELGKLDVYVALSRAESFGVAIIEASAVGLPVIVSDAGGLPEVVIDGETGIVVPSGNEEMAADAMIRLAHDEEARRFFGQAGRKYVESTFAWTVCVNNVKRIYSDLSKNSIN